MEVRQHLFIDFEFTMPDKGKQYKGFYPEIIEVGVVSVINNQIFEEFSSYVTPTQYPKLSKRCKSFLNISQQQVDDGIAFSELVHKLKEMTGEHSYTIVTWGNTDMKVLRSNCEKAGLHFPFTGKEVDLSMEYKRFFGDKNQTGLWKAVQEYGKDGVGLHHRALDDALTTYKIFKLVEKDKQYLQKHEPTTIGDRVDLAELFNKFA
ncbi:3'-5' exonuclease KapD [Cytobacillus gottheilii]|uniref:3'-5' exonuclease KapD n=1 Tax=Cytobacillus gottheilii TaxID=859144 RepID=A0ABX8F8V0_9BACI|nr:3'-5' exonuclease KapD [Cytobacillus gottheilii]QVY60861.1 3'-5' exonuclease KapD [Cytobacillus gottheilii]